MEFYRFRRQLPELPEPAEPAELPGVGQKPENGARVTRAGNRDDVSMPQANSLKQTPSNYPSTPFRIHRSIDNSVFWHLFFHSDGGLGTICLQKR